MNAFPYFSDDDVRNILAYIDQAPEKQVTAAATTSSGEFVNISDDKTNDYLILTIAIVLLLVIAGLWKIKNTLKQLAGEESQDLFQSSISLLNSYLESKQLP